MLWEFANGIDHSEVQPEQSEAKGVGNSTTLSEDAATVEEAMKVFYKLAKVSGQDCEKQDREPEW